MKIPLIPNITHKHAQQKNGPEGAVFLNILRFGLFSLKRETLESGNSKVLIQSLKILGNSLGLIAK